MSDDEFESFDNLDDLDWSDVEEELKANKEQIIAAAANTGDDAGGFDMGEMMEPQKSSAPALPKGALDINFLLDVQLQISVEVGRTRMVIQELLELDEQSIVELDTMIGQPLDIRINEKLVARGEVVVINDKFAVRISEIISPDERFAAL